MGKKKTKSKSKNAKKSSRKNRDQPSSPPIQQSPTKTDTTASPCVSPSRPPAASLCRDLGDDCWKRIISHLSTLDRIRLAFTSKRLGNLCKVGGPCIPVGAVLGQLAAEKPVENKQLALIRAHNAALNEWHETFANVKATKCLEKGFDFQHPAENLAQAIFNSPFPDIPGFKEHSNIVVKTRGGDIANLPWIPLEELFDNNIINHNPQGYDHNDESLLIATICSACSTTWRTSRKSRRGRRQTATVALSLRWSLRLAKWSRTMVAGDVAINHRL
jgi:hypothetical protein